MSTIKLEKFIQAPASEVYTYFTNSTAIRDWMCDVATTSPRPGGHIFMSWDDGYYTSGEFVKLEKDKSITFTWHGRGEPYSTTVDITLKGSKKGTQLKLAHRNIGRGKKWEGIANNYQVEWHNALENLSSLLGEGPDLRISRRPMLGITVGNYDAEIAKKLGIPKEYGLMIDGVLEGMGAQKAGLQSEDVITTVDGQEIDANRSFGSIISKKHAGDLVEVGFFRGGQKKTTSMILSGRPLPTLPNSNIMFQKELEPIYRQVEEQVEELLHSATEGEWAAKPKTGEWSANEVLAHLIHTEVGWQNIITELVEGYEGSYDGYGGNLQARVDATIMTFLTAARLFEVFKAANAETLYLISRLPDEFFKRKGKLWKLAFLTSQNPYHTQTHIGQIQSAITAARAS